MRKLSDAQITALNDIREGAYAKPRPNTVDALLKRGSIREVINTTGGFNSLELTDQGRQEIGLPATPADAPVDPIVGFVPNRADRRAAIRAQKVMNRAAMRRHGRRMARYGQVAA